MLTRIILLLCVISAVVLAGCGDDDPTTTATPVPATATPVVEASPTLAPVPTRQPDPNRPANIVLLLELETGTQTEIFEDKERVPYDIQFASEDEVVVRYMEPDHSRFEVRLGLDGTELSRGAPTGGCTEVSGGVEVGGKMYPDAYCGHISPNGDWMTYQVPRPDSQRGDWDQWLINLRTDTRTLLQAEMRHCGGCDSRFGPEWSPNSRYLYFPELLQSGRTFLTDTATGTTHLLFEGSTELPAQPDWSPDGNTLAYRKDVTGPTILENFTTDQPTFLLSLTWPARFDESGKYLYSPHAGYPQQPATTSIYDLSNGSILVTLPGQPHHYNWYSEFPPVVDTSQGLIAALNYATECDGLSVYRDGVYVNCVQGGGPPRFSPDGLSLATTRRSSSSGLYDVLVVDSVTGAERVVVSGVFSFQDPYLTWNEAGTHLLVRAPFGGFGP